MRECALSGCRGESWLRSTWIEADITIYIVTILQPPLYAVIGAEQSGHKEFIRICKSEMNADKKVQEARTMKRLVASE